MKNNYNHSLLLGTLLNLLLPGLGHVFWKEYLFGLFVFLIMLITSVLVFVSFLVKFPLMVKVVLFGLPVIFYFFSFFDLARIIRNKASLCHKTVRTVLVFILLGVLYQIFAPNAAGNFIFKNFPVIFTLSDNRYSPVYSGGEILKASRLAYSIDIVGFDGRVIHTVPQRYDFIRYRDSNSEQVGLVVGLPGEEIQIISGEVLSTEYALFDEKPAGLSLSGDWPLTSVGPYSILVAVLKFGTVQKVQEINLSDVIGKVERLF